MTTSTYFPSLPVFRGVTSGVGAWIGGYLLSYALIAPEIRTSSLAQFLAASTGQTGEWRLVGWVFYSAHFAETSVPESFGSETVNLVATIHGTSAVLYLIPPLSLVLAGFVVQFGNPRLTDGGAATYGLAVVLGYLPAALAGLIGMTVRTNGVFAGPTAVSALVLVGIVYPLVFGPIGAVLGNRL